MSGLPWWVKAVVIVGVPSAIALGLVWSDRVQLSTNVRENGALMHKLDSGASAHDARVTGRFDDLSMRVQESNRILLAQCVNEAKTPEARERCVGR
jgi:hypothetical protein